MCVAIFYIRIAPKKKDYGGSSLSPTQIHFMFFRIQSADFFPPGPHNHFNHHFQSMCKAMAMAIIRLAMWQMMNSCICAVILESSSYLGDQIALGMGNGESVNGEWG